VRITRLEQATAKQHREKEASCLTRRRPDHIVADFSKAVLICHVSSAREVTPPKSRERTVVNYSTKHCCGYMA
jgi:hypothetical protein